MRRIPLIVLVLLIASAATLAAQERQPRSFCFRGQPLAACRSYLVFEFTGAARVAGTTHAFYDRREADMGEFVAWDLGAMRNRDSTHAVGLSIEAGGSGGGTRFALKARQRTWLRNNFTLDVAAGPLAAQQQSAMHDGTRQAYGVTGEVAAGAKDLASLVLGADFARVDQRSTSALYVGGRLGPHGAAAASIIAIVGVIALIRALSGAAY